MGDQGRVGSEVGMGGHGRGGRVDHGLGLGCCWCWSELALACGGRGSSQGRWGTPSRPPPPATPTSRGQLQSYRNVAAHPTHAPGQPAALSGRHARPGLLP